MFDFSVFETTDYPPAFILFISPTEGITLHYVAAELIKLEAWLCTIHLGNINEKLRCQHVRVHIHVTHAAKYNIDSSIRITKENKYLFYILQNISLYFFWGKKCFLVRPRAICSITEMLQSTAQVIT